MVIFLNYNDFQGGDCIITVTALNNKKRYFIEIYQNARFLSVCITIYTISCWGKAVKQLSKTQKALKLNDAIKIILVYEDYYQSECLDLLFDIDTTLVNDNRYWLVTIREFEMLMHLYKISPELFNDIISEKIEAEQNKSLSGRDLSYFLSQHGINKNQYLIDAKITDNLDAIKSILDKEINCEVK